MKYILILITAIIALVLLSTAVMVYLSSQDEEEVVIVPDTPLQGNVFPTEPTQGITIGESQPVANTTTLSRVLSYSKLVRDPMNQDEYVIHGNTSVCASAENCEENVTQDFSVVYDATEDFFMIVLYQEPIGLQREAAEKILVEELRFSQDELCGLNSQVSVPYWVSETYAGVNLKFSFCPDAVQL